MKLDELILQVCLLQCFCFHEIDCQICFLEDMPQSIIIILHIYLWKSNFKKKKAISNGYSFSNFGYGYDIWFLH